MNKKVLSVDDSSSMRHIIKSCLEREGFDVQEAEDGLDALKTIESSDGFDLLIVDVNMPNMDGITFVKELRKNPTYSSTPILMLTTEGATNVKVEGAQAGATGWVTKPFEPSQFVQVVKRLAR